ncbi:SH3 domain-containing protein [Anatilimnocola floriformis]|uniref:SH3 domain-containing protein n=1 Tax=Anatilimnocola floriformis TaxID=2948575 RepID=UPI0020C4AE52|nr:SH3 domain-containing protein [Anatilimnocola floriformis]
MVHRVLIAALLFTLPAMAVAADQYPYTAYVAVDEVNVVSGPSTRNYATHRLYAGDEVQVYRREATGWLAIRPPEDSYSWIVADAVEETNDQGIYRVLIAVPAYIHSIDSAVRNFDYQVKLRPGELVEVVGEKTVKTAQGPETWLKIAPPAGEFRYIHINQISKSPPREADLAVAKEKTPPREYREVQVAVGTGVNRMKESMNALASLNAARREKPTQPAMVLSDLNGKVDSDVRLVEHQQPVNVARDYTASPDGFVKRKPRPIENTAGVPAPSSDLRMASREQMQNSIHGSPRSTNFQDLPAQSTTSTQPTSQSSGLKPAPAIRNDGPGFDALNATEKLKALDLELSSRISQPRETWNLESIRNKVQRIVDEGNSPTERGQARLLLEKIRKFEEAFDLPNDPILAARSKSGTASAADARYDGVGLLQPILDRDLRVSANYALVDSEGKPIAFVTPGPGMNLRRYENKPVGIYGKRGMVEKLNKPHIVAERVIELSTR